MRAFPWLSRESYFVDVLTPAEADSEAGSLGAWKPLYRREAWIAASILLLVLNAVFFPFLWGRKTLLSSSNLAPSIMATGAFGSRPETHISRLLDPASPAWQLEPSLAFTHREYFSEKLVPLWDPYRAFGTPFAAAMQSQPFYPLTILLALHPGPRTYNIFVVGRLFIAGLFGYLFFRLFLSFFPSVTGAISLMLSGYFILYLNISHLSVDVLIGAVFYSVERFLRQPGLKTILFMACILFLSVIGGMPETAFLLWCYGYAYALFRLATAPELRSGWASRAKGLVLASALGLGGAAFLMLPFLEFLRHSFDAHQFENVGAYIGLGHEYLHGSGYTLLRVLAMYLAPLLQGPPWQNILQHFGGHSGVRAYFGVVSFVLALIGIFVTGRELARHRSNAVVSLGVFFFASSLLFWMKKFGSVAVNWIGYLPAFNLIVFPKYIELLQAMAIASLAAIGCSYLLDRRLPVKWIIAPVVTVIIGLTIVFKTTLPLVQRPSTVNGFFFYVALLSVFGLLLLIVLTVLYFRDAGSPHSHSQVAFGSCILLLVAGELCLNFLVPTLYILNRPPNAKLSAYKEI